MNDFDVKEVLLGLAADGNVMGKCPKCNLPLHFYEITDCKCETCGHIIWDEIIFVKINKENAS